MIDVNYYTGDITPDDKTIFVFGSNPEGRHGAGSAKIAHDLFGAEYGVGEGLTGNAYAIPTKDLRVKENNGYKSISPDVITRSICRMYDCAEAHPDKLFKVAYRNTDKPSLNGYTGFEMMNMFDNAGVPPKNVIFSLEWRDAWIPKVTTLYSDQNLTLDRMNDGDYRLTLFKDHHWAGDMVFNENGIFYNEIKDNDE